MKLTRNSLPAEVPTSSMADIAFLLIVFFMLTTVFSSNAGINFVLPKSDEEQGEPDPAVFIHVHPSGDFTMDGTDYSAAQTQEVFNYVSAKIQVNAKKPIILYTNREAPYGSMVGIMDQLKSVEKTLDGGTLAITIPTKEEGKYMLSTL